MDPRGPSGPLLVGGSDDRAVPVPDLVIDTNVVLDMLVFRDPHGLAVMKALATRRYRWIGCPSMRTELAHVLAQDGLHRWEADREAVLDVYDSSVVALDPPTPRVILRCSDANDQVFIDLAVQRRAHALLTRDRALLRLATRARGFGVVVAGPETWLAKFQTGARLDRETAR